MSQRRGRSSHRGASPPGARDARPPVRSGPIGDPAVLRVRLREIIEPVVVEAGYDVEGLSVSRAGRRHLVRLTVDGDGGVSLDAVAAVSRQVSAALDAAEAAAGEIVAGEYELQVSSPGVDRPLVAPRHWRRNVGRLVQVRVADRQVTGRVLAADADGVVLDVDGTQHEVGYPELGSGQIQLEFTRLASLSDADLDELLEPVDDDTDDDTDPVDETELAVDTELDEEEEEEDGA
jgi:ribosome maturation factor RimP